MQLLFHGLHVGDGAHHATCCVQLSKRIDGIVERLGVERAETFVDEQRLEHLAAAGTAVTDHIGQSECQRERRLELLATRQRGSGSIATRVGVEHPKREPALAGGVAEQAVAVPRHAIEVSVGGVRDAVEFACQHPPFELHAHARLAVAGCEHDSSIGSPLTKIGRAGCHRLRLVEFGAGCRKGVVGRGELRRSFADHRAYRICCLGDDNRVGPFGRNVLAAEGLHPARRRGEIVAPPGDGSRPFGFLVVAKHHRNRIVD